MARLVLHLFGPPEVTLDGEPVAGLSSDKVRALLFYLAVEQDHPHRRESLAGLLWPDYPERSARTNLSNALSNLRAAIGDREATAPYLLVSREAIQFNVDSDCAVDVNAFDEHVAGKRWEEAVAAYRGPFLEGFSPPDSPSFEQWALVVRERLQREMMAALEGLTVDYEEIEDYARAIETARRQLELEPWHEGAHRALMRLLALSGERASALAQYEVCVRVLREELDTEPSPDTVALYERIRDGSLVEPAAAAPPQLQEEPPRHNLPAQLTPFVGREGLLEQIRERLADPHCRLLTLVGPGGSGKTRLALEAAARQVDCYPHGVWFVSLAPLQSSESIVPTTAQALGFSFYEGPPPRQQLLDYLREKRMLLVLDNYEHLLSGATLVTDILKAASRVKVVTTSRARLNVQGEQLFPVSGMNVPDRQPTGEGDTASEQAIEYSAVRLFVQGARQVQPGFEPTTEDLGHVVHVCQLVDGTPLAILLAAGWVRVLSPAEIACEIAQSLDFLESGQQDVPERHTSVRAVFDHSWRLLSEHEQSVLAGLSVFRGGLTREAAQQVAGASLRDLASLVDRSLLHRTPTGRYEIHELLRQYAFGKLAKASKAGKAARDRHCAFYAAALCQWATSLQGALQQAAAAEIEADIENAHAAWNWAIEQGWTKHIGQAVEGLCRLYEWCGRFREGEAACRLAAETLEPCRKQLSTSELRTLAKVWAWQGVFSRTLGQPKRVHELLHQGLSLLDDPVLDGQDTRPERAFILQQMGNVAVSSKRDEASRLYEKSLALYRALGDQWGTANTLNRLGNLAFGLGDYAQAERMYQQSLAIRRSLNDRTGIADSLIGLGHIAGDKGQLEEAERLVREAIAIYQEIGDRVGLQKGLDGLAGKLLYLGKFAEAHSLLEECVEIRNELGMCIASAWANNTLGWVKANLGLYDQVRALAQTNLALFRKVGSGRGIGMSLLSLSNMALVEGEHTKAQQWLKESAAAFREMGQQDELGLTHINSAYAARGLGHYAESQQYLCQALQIGTEIGAFFLLITALPAIALLLVDQGKVEGAVELYALASRYPYVANSRWFEDVVGKHVDAAAADLPPDVVAAARERGRARDLDAAVQELLDELTKP